MLLNRAWIENRIPHHGRMCLLDEVIAWSAARISCRGSSHRDADNPLRAYGRLGIAGGIEYASQAMAVHGALMADSDNGAPQAGLRFAEAPVTGSPAAGSPAAGLPATGSPANGLPAIASPAAGLLVAVRDVRFHASRLDDVPGDLICDAVRMAGDATTALYEFEVRSERKRLLHGRATVVFDATLYTSRRLG